MAENGSGVKPGFRSTEVWAGILAMAGVVASGSHDVVGQAAQTIASTDPKMLLGAASMAGPYAPIAAGAIAIAILWSRTRVKNTDREAQKDENIAKHNVEVARLNAEKALAELHKVKEEKKTGNGA